MLVYTADSAKQGWKVVIAEEVPYYFKATLTANSFLYLIVICWSKLKIHRRFFAFSPEQ